MKPTQPDTHKQEEGFRRDMECVVALMNHAATNYSPEDREAFFVGLSSFARGMAHAVEEITDNA